MSVEYVYSHYDLAQNVVVLGLFLFFSEGGVYLCSNNFATIFSFQWIFVVTFFFFFFQKN